MATALDFFQKYFDLEWEAHVAYATNPDMDAANAVNATFSAHRRPGVREDYERTKWDDEDDLADWMDGAAHRTLWAVATHRDGKAAIAYASGINGNTTKSFSERFAAIEEGDKWVVLASQSRCFKCRPGEPCSRCDGSGWSDWNGEAPEELGPATAFTRYAEPTEFSRSGVDFLAGSNGTWPDPAG